ncbi:hypothetical protein GCM10023086_69750 [Streptomyces venetus]|uniref:HTH marR-type domain-containing protein n=1 Tax=Streptomyces venetus TaxID=1701086 RepID=A0ABP8HA12_9ACTN
MRGAEVELLRLVVTRPGIGISDAARDLGLAANSVSTLVNQLPRAGCLVRETDPADRRAARLLPDRPRGPDHRQGFRGRCEVARPGGVVLLIAALLGAALTWNPAKLLAVAAIVVLGSARSSALYPVSVMPGRLQAVSKADPLGYEVLGRLAR